MLYNLFENRDFVSVFAVALLAEGVDRNWLTAFGAALLIWLDSKGVFDVFGAWLGRVLRDTAVGDLIRKFM